MCGYVSSHLSLALVRPISLCPMTPWPGHPTYTLMKEQGLHSTSAPTSPTTTTPPTPLPNMTLSPPTHPLMSTLVTCLCLRAPSVHPLPCYCMISLLASNNDQQRKFNTGVKGTNRQHNDTNNISLGSLLGLPAELSKEIAIQHQQKHKKQQSH